MKRIMVLLFIFYAITVIAQDNDIVDQKNGFKSLKLGDHFFKYYGYLEETDRPNIFRYTGDCCTDVFGFPIAFILLTFENYELKTINIIMPQGQGDSYDKSRVKYLDDSFLAAFGDYSATKEDDTTGNMGSQWRGKKAMISITYNYMGYKVGWWATITVQTLDKLNNGF